MKFSDIKLDEQDAKFVQNLFNAKEDEYELLHGFKMSPSERYLARKNIVNDFKNGIWDNRDYSEADSGMHWSDNPRE